MPKLEERACGVKAQWLASRCQENNRIRLMGLGIPDRLCDISVVAGATCDTTAQVFPNRFRVEGLGVRV